MDGGEGKESSGFSLGIHRLPLRFIDIGSDKITKKENGDGEKHK